MKPIEIFEGGKKRAAKMWDAWMINGAMTHRGPGHKGLRVAMFICIEPIHPVQALYKHDGDLQISAPQAVAWFQDIEGIKLYCGDIAMLEWAEYQPWRHLRVSKELKTNWLSLARMYFPNHVKEIP